MQDDVPQQSVFRRISTKIIGRPRNINDPSIFHKLSLIALLSWIGLGADGLSSSSYGPEEAFKVIIDGGHTYLAVFLAIATAVTVFIISYTYSKIIEKFPHGGGGYIVATHTLGKSAGVVSGSALLIDYILTITVSIAACGDAIFSFLPLEYHQYSLIFKISLIFILILLNLRGIKESVTILAPIFLLFIITHVLLLGYGIISQASAIGSHVNQFSTGLSGDLQTIGLLGILAIFLRAFSLGGGTYTGIEAVSNGLPVMREPKVKTGKRTMMYMAVSLSLVAGALFFCYYLLDIQPVQGQTLNAVLANNLFGGWPGGIFIAAVIIFSEGLLLFVAAQTGFIDGPRVMANMAVDSWFPKKFAALSERLTMRNGVLVMGLAALFLMIGTNGSISFLVIMYAINVFLTFSLSQVGMARFTIKNRKKKEHWIRYLLIFVIGFTLCFTILIVTIYEKIGEGGWLTLIITLAVIFICYLIRSHYYKIKKAMKKFDEVLLLSSIHLVGHLNTKPVNPKHMTAVILVTGYSGYGVNTFLSLIRSFPGLYKNIIFVSIAEIDSGSFKGAEEVEALKTSVQSSLLKYVQLAQRLGFSADYRMDVGTDVVETASHLCESIAEEFPKVMFFTAKLVFRHETIFHKILHNETAFSVQRRLQWKGLPVVILPVRIDI
ncbi:MAG: APC family permease [Candidatus Thermoplasmatota archaeon]|jgi:amino acid transporter|nr:APC family permease [Candidatus Thermoplasmatota archaeon]